MYFQANIYLFIPFSMKGIGMKNRVVEDLNTEYHKLSFYNAVIKQSRSQVHFWLSISFGVQGYLGYLYFVMKMSNYPLSFTYLSVSLLIAFLFLLFTVARMSKFMKRDARYRAYCNTWKSGWSMFRYRAALDAYRYDRIKAYLGHKNMDRNDKLEQLIALLETEQQAWTQANWKPIAIIGLMLFPLVGEYVGFRYNLVLEKQNASLAHMLEQYPDELKQNTVYESIFRDAMDFWSRQAQWDGLALMLHGLAPFLISLGLYIWGINIMLERVVLRKRHERLALIRILRLIRINQ
ncbi:hypothetical protein IM700_016965 [Paenibacillus sp. DXFW5]|uniref:Uncharacterized protein n=1 Tax=Paenibacillus rhizolycopersici TaxID=2780073 RepID=A0ABS2H7E5_9BACL|nr:hypothetical protein [Paenibacillus rhizolycopersici]MBM6997352.1 hypothetical protein [Paenibacillus rhizolycopersici]